MKIFVVPRNYIEQQINKDPNWYQNKWIISIYSKGSYSPLIDRYNIAKYEFDDVSDSYDKDYDSFMFFDKQDAKHIHEFARDIIDDGSKPIYIHCDAGVSRSGAVGYILNEYYNKFLTDNKEDYDFFNLKNSHILPNPLVVRLLKKEFFGNPFFK